MALEVVELAVRRENKPVVNRMEGLTSPRQVIDRESGVPEGDPFVTKNELTVSVGSAVNDRFELTFENVGSIFREGVGREVAGNAAHNSFRKSC